MEMLHEDDKLTGGKVANHLGFTSSRSASRETGSSKESQRRETFTGASEYVPNRVALEGASCSTIPELNSFATAR